MSISRGLAEKNYSHWHHQDYRATKMNAGEMNILETDGGDR